MSENKVWLLVAATIIVTTACTELVADDSYDVHNTARAEYCERVADFERTKHLPLEDIKGHSNYLGEDCEQTNN